MTIPPSHSNTAAVLLSYPVLSAQPQPKPRHNPNNNTMSFDTEVLIIGAGMSGLGLAVQIVRRFGIKNFELIEKSNDVGGTWLANTYPGCGCDVASHFYSYSFALNPDWSRKYSMREEIQRYFRNVSDRFGVTERVRFHSVVESARWDEEAKVWVVNVLDLQTKERVVRRAKVLISGVGSLSVPKECDIPGKDEFKGKMFHSAQWDHSFDWGNKDVVVLGMNEATSQGTLAHIYPRQRLLSNPVRPHHVRRSRRQTSSPQNHTVCPASAIPLRAREPLLLVYFQSRDALRSTSHAAVPGKALLRHGI